MLNYEVIELQENKLESILKDYPNSLETGMKFIDSQRKVGRGPLDLLMLDSGNALVIVELKVNKDDDMLFQALDYYDYIYANKERLAYAYKSKGLNIDPSEEPRIILIAPEFSQLLINRCKWLKVKIDLYRYRYLDIKKGEESVGNIVDFIPVEVSSIPEPEEVWSKEDILNYITLQELKEAAKSYMKEIESWYGVRGDIIQGAISYKIGPNTFAYFHPLRSGFRINGYLSGREWQSIALVYDKDDLQDAISKTKEAYENIKQT